MTVQRSQSSIKPGQTATYLVQVSAKDAAPSHVSVALTAQPTSQKPEFSSGCATDDGTASCTIGSMTAGQTVSLDAKIAVASNATTSSVKLTATASVITTATWTPPAAAETTAVTAASPSASASAKKANKTQNSSSSSAAPDVTHMAVLPLGPIPALNGAASMVVGAGNAAGLFPAITPSPVAKPGPSVQPRPSQSQRKAAPISNASPISVDTPVFTAQVTGLIALGLAIMLTVTRLTVRKRPGKPRG